MDYFVLRFDHSYRKEDFRALSKLAGKTTRKWSSRIISVFGFAVGLFSLQVETLTMKFSDEGLAQSSSKAAASVPYHAFERLYHYRDRYFLFVDKLHAYILPEDRFVVGDSADFRAFIEAKTGKTVEYI